MPQLRRLVARLHASKVTFHSSRVSKSWFELSLFRDATLSRAFWAALGRMSYVRQGTLYASFRFATVLGLRLRKKSCLQNQQVLRRSFPDCGEWNAGIESNEPSFMLNRESKQINVSQLPRSMNSPEFMDILVAGIG
jgi:hypothetical protein